jgi:radical SAM superfamily enzyme YgiQ (UPF0313 family)
MLSVRKTNCRVRFLKKEFAMKVLLVGPDQEENLSLRYLSASLRQGGHEVELARFNTVRDSYAVVEAATRADIVGLSMCFQARANEFVQLAELIKAQVKGAPLIAAGGHHASSEAEALLMNHPALDVIAIHEAEQTLVEIADRAATSRDFRSISGVAFRGADNRIVFTPKRKIEEDLDRLPLPDRTGPVMMLGGVPTAYLMGSRGCLWSCSYCSITTLHRMAEGKRFRQRTPKSIAEEMSMLFRDRGIRQFIFHDDNFLVPSAADNHLRIASLEEELHRLGVRDIALVLKFRPGDADRSILEKLKQMGLIRVFLGIESSTETGLSCLNRRQSVEESIRALDLCCELGISTQYTMMMFHPNSTMETIESDIRFMRRYGSMPLNFCRTELYSGTPLLRQMKDMGRAKGNYKAWTYSLTDPVADLVCDISKKLFFDRCWSYESLHQKSIGFDHLSQVVKHFYSAGWVSSLCSDIERWLTAVNADTLSLLEDVIAQCKATPERGHPTLMQTVELLEVAERTSRASLLHEYESLRRRMDTLTDAAIRRERIGSAGNKSLPKSATRHAAAALLATALGACNTIGISEYAAPPMEDSDGDGLPDQCEEDIFGTSPTIADSNDNGIPDGEEDHDQDGMTNLEEQQVWGDEMCADAVPVDAGDGTSSEN